MTHKAFLVTNGNFFLFDIKLVTYPNLPALFMKKNSFFRDFSPSQLNEKTTNTKTIKKAPKNHQNG